MIALKQDVATTSNNLGWRELLWSMSWLRPGGKNKLTLIPRIMQNWAFIMVIHRTPGCVYNFRTNKKYLRREIAWQTQKQQR